MMDFHRLGILHQLGQLLTKLSQHGLILPSSSAFSRIVCFRKAYRASSNIARCFQHRSIFPIWLAFFKHRFSHHCHRAPLTSSSTASRTISSSMDCCRHDSLCTPFLFTAFSRHNYVKRIHLLHSTLSSSFTAYASSFHSQSFETLPGAPHGQTVLTRSKPPLPSDCPSSPGRASPSTPSPATCSPRSSDPLIALPPPPALGQGTARTRWVPSRKSCSQIRPATSLGR